MMLVREPESASTPEANRRVPDSSRLLPGSRQWPRRGSARRPARALRSPRLSANCDRVNSLEPLACYFAILQEWERRSSESQTRS